MANNQHKVNYTNLQETYMYKYKEGISDRKNFYEYYKNDENSIDDPIFTGFTFDIDMNTSPLFHNGEGDSYTTNFDALRSLTGGNTTLAGQIENYLTKVYKNAVIGAVNSYEINTVNIKDRLLYSARRIGYGLQENVYMDNILYGATEYIYMVDKVSDGMYNDIAGTDYVGNGTPNSSVYDDYQKDMDKAVADATANGIPLKGLNVNEADIPSTLDEDTGAYTYALNYQINKLNDAIDNDQDMQEEHLINESDVMAAEAGYKVYESKYNELVEEKKKLSDAIDKDKSDVKSEFEELKSKMTSALAKYNNNNSDSNDIYTLYDEFEAFSSRISSGTTYKNINVTLSEGDGGNTTDDLIKKANKVINSTMNNPTITTESQNSLNDYSAQIKECEITMFGSDDKGNPKSQANATEDSLYGKLQKANEVAKSDKYTQATNQVDSLKSAEANIEDTLSHTEYQQGKCTSVEAQMPVIDRDKYETDDDYQKARSTRVTSEVPQTVLDMLGFIYGMKKITHDYPYIMQSVTGLDEAYKKYFSLKEPYMGSGDDKITINCYESLDMRVSSMFNKYFNAVYDHQYKRERVPINLRRFNCSIFVHDIRNFRHALGSRFPDKFQEYADGDNPSSKITELALNYASVIEFKFYDCEIVPEETGSIFDNVSNESAGDMRRTNFTFTYGNCVINYLPFEDLSRYYLRSNVSKREKIEEFSSKGNVYDDSITTESVLNEPLGWTTDEDRMLYVEDGFLGNVNGPQDMVIGVIDRIFKGMSASTGMPVEDVKKEFGFEGDKHHHHHHHHHKKDISSLGNVYTPESSGELQTEIGKIDGDYTVNGISTDLGDLVVDNSTSSIQTEIGNIPGEYDVNGIVSNLGDLVVDNSTNEIQTEIGKIPGEYTVNGISTDLGDLVVDNSTNEIQTEIGKIPGDYTINGISRDLGDLVVDNSTNKIMTEIGKLPGDYTENGITTELGDLVVDNSTNEIRTEIGKLDLGYKTNGVVSGIGDLIKDNSTSNMTSEIGRIDGYGDHSYEMTDELGGISMKSSFKEHTIELGKIPMDSKFKEMTDDLGDVSGSKTVKEIVDDLGDIEGYDIKGGKPVDSIDKI